MGGDLKVTREVAFYLSKLMSYKDEYEVGRLYSSKQYWDRLNQAFEGDFKVKIQMAPPVFAKPRKPGGEPEKIEFGPWIFPVLRMLGKMKGLRGGMFDIFGYSAERKMERRLIGEYRDLIEGLLPRLTPGTQAEIAEIAALPDMVRGYGPIKERNVESYEEEKAKLLARLDEPVQQAA
ncbi:DUF6537 domain-containing protein [Croceicoccus sp. YJ47]|uniref:DUF6537 domain-containing protein n=1 Tax=Croceicoccus sp. YJ47 TaxID=2798724 RepID=UPI00192133A4|nr:DUF6537 domain-containing protein [Croceicoccus sp. YJ47]QQN75301.1 hypothetical protein JD971_06490 [Croceicoccus sp. YJ47]